MISATVLRSHLDFSSWASRQLMEAAVSLPLEEANRDLRTSYQSIAGTLAHIYKADRIWLDRIHARQTFQFSDDFSLDALVTEWPALHASWREWAAGLDDDGFQRVAAYRLLSGDPGESPLWQIVLHVVNHASYHRGQIVTMLRQLGRTPPSTDLIRYYRLKC